jgi:plastocyanin
MEKFRKRKINQNHMSKKIIYGAITIVIFCLAGFGAYLYDKSLAPAGTNQDKTNNVKSAVKNSPLGNPPGSSATPAQNQQMPPALKSTPAPADKPVFSSGEGLDAGSNIQVYEVDFDGTAFSPKEITVKAGDYIFFKNKSTGNFLPVSSAAGYLNFGATKPIAPGAEYRFQFNKAGRLDYRDQATASATGTVVVTQ